jgi:hypothetical protein
VEKIREYQSRKPELPPDELDARLDQLAVADTEKSAPAPELSPDPVIAPELAPTAENLDKLQ